MLDNTPAYKKTIFTVKPGQVAQCVTSSRKLETQDQVKIMFNNRLNVTFTYLTNQN